MARKKSPQYKVWYGSLVVYEGSDRTKAVDAWETLVPESVRNSRDSIAQIDVDGFNETSRVLREYAETA